MRFKELSMGAQTAYAEVAEQTQSLELQFSLSKLPGSFHKRTIKGKAYWYFGYRDIDRQVRMIYVGPDSERVKNLVAQFGCQKGGGSLAPQAQSAIVLGCAAVLPKHFRIIRRLSEYGFFKAGGILIGTHAFLALGNMLGVKWSGGEKTMDVDFAHAGKNVSIALPASISIDVHGALESLEMGLLPITQFNGKVGAQYRSPGDPELRLDFVTCKHRKSDAICVPHLNIALEPLKFMEFSLQDSTQGCMLGKGGACTVNLPSPERYAVHKLIISGERPVSERVKSTKDILQAACLASYFLETGRCGEFNAAWQDALSRGKGWRSRAIAGKEAMLRVAPELGSPLLWKV